MHIHCSRCVNIFLDDCIGQKNNDISKAKGYSPLMISIKQQFTRVQILQWVHKLKCCKSAEAKTGLPCPFFFSRYNVAQFQFDLHIMEIKKKKDESNTA